jgi:hypothetical protein
MTHQFSKFILTAGLSALLGASAAVAQNRAEVADVPFTFHAAQHTFAAGQYTVAEQTASGLFRLSSADGQSVYVSMHPGKASDPEQPKLTFVRQGEEYVLAGLSMPGSIAGWEESQSAMEKDMTRKLGVAAMISVPLKSR